MSSSHEHSPRSYAAFLACCLVWGSTFLVIGIGNDALPPLWAATLRLIIAATLLTLLTRLTGHALPRGDAFRAAVWFGFLNFGLNFCLLYWAETRIPTGLVAVLYATIPLSSSLFARLFGIETLSRGKLLGAAIALAGVGLIMWNQIGRGADLLATLAALCAATLASLSGVLLKRGPRQHPMGANAVAAWVGLAVCGTISFVARETHPIPGTMATLGPILYLAVMGSVIAFVLYAWLVNHWPVSRLGFLSVVAPVIALLLGASLRHESLSAREVAGTALVLAGLGLGIGSDLARKATARP